MALRLRGSHIIALGIAAGIAAWMFTGEVKIGGEAENGAAAVPIAEREAERDQERFKVRYVSLRAEERAETIRIRGRTEADSIVTIRAETAGVLENRLVDKGDIVKSGDLVCEIDPGARMAQLAQAEAQLVQAEADYSANVKLKKQGFAAENRVNALKSAFDAAKAALAAAKEEMERTKIRANASGVVQDPIAEIGDTLSVGGTCVTLIDTDPMLFTGQISERDIGRVSTGMKADVELITGDTVAGNIRYIAPSADPQTRTFRTEIELSDTAKVRDGMTAQAVIVLPAGEAFRIAPSWITLADDGAIGIRIVNAEETVEFVPVKILAQQQDGFWVNGPKEGDRIITLGQEYVVAGEKVAPLPDDRADDRLAKAGGKTAEAKKLDR